ncbi:hypothetical protein ACNZ61_002920 [Enterococcus hirae]
MIKPDMTFINSVPESTLSNAANSSRGSDGLSGMVIKSISKALNKAPGAVFDDLLIVEEALKNLNENEPFSVDSKVYWTLINDQTVVLKDFDYIKNQVVFALNDWLEMMEEPAEDRDFSGEFYQYVWFVLEQDDAFYPSDKEGNRIED